MVRVTTSSTSGDCNNQVFGERLHATTRLLPERLHPLHLGGPNDYFIYLQGTAYVYIEQGQSNSMTILAGDDAKGAPTLVSGTV